MRPSEPTTTGTATSSATSDSLSVPMLPVVAEERPERADQRPGPEVDREPDGRHRQHQPRRPRCRAGLGLRGQRSRHCRALRAGCTSSTMALHGRFANRVGHVGSPHWPTSGRVGRAATSAVDPRTSRQGRKSRPSEATGPSSEAASRSHHRKTDITGCHVERRVPSLRLESVRVSSGRGRCSGILRQICRDDRVADAVGRVLIRRAVRGAESETLGCRQPSGSRPGANTRRWSIATKRCSGSARLISPTSATRRRR